MKKRFILFASLPLLLASSLSFARLHKAPIEVKAEASSYSTYTLPTTIDLNPVSESDIRSYYSALDGKSLQGEELLKALKPILKEGQRYHSYDNGKNVWKAYEITDRDWELSPASSTVYGTYDESKNIITDYQYGDSSSNAKNNPYQHLFYRNRGVEETKHRAWDQHGKNNGTDREHIWPKSRGFGKNDGEEVGVPGARGDLHHLVAGDSYVNSSTHSNNSYGFVKMDTVTDDAGAKFKINDKVVVAGNYRGQPLNVTGESKTEVFEPQDCDKGDIARACFYMVARYNNLAGDDNAIDAGNPNLTFNDEISTETVYSTASSPVSIGILRDLLAWHKLDPVDEYEIHRNDLIYRNYDHNRNPFIDFPDWVDAIWGEVELESDNRTVKSRNAAPKGFANPSSDKIYALGGGSSQSSSSSSSSSVSSQSSSDTTPSSNPTGTELPLPFIIGIGVAVVVVLMILFVVATKGKGKAKKKAKKILKTVAQGKSSQSKNKGSSKKKK